MNFTITEAAQDQIRQAISNQGDANTPKNAMRVEAHADGGADFSYGLKLIVVQESAPDDEILDFEGFKVLIDPGSARNLEGASLDFEDRLVRSGFKFDNPNKPEIPAIGSGERTDLTGKTAEKVQRLIDTELNPAVAAHGGNITLTGVQDDKVYLSFGGGCHGCGMVDVTLKQGVEARIRELIPEVQEVVDTTDHSTGENPFYA